MITWKMTVLRKFMNCSYALITTVMRIIIRDNYAVMRARMCIIPSQLRMCALPHSFLPITLLCMVGDLIFTTLRARLKALRQSLKSNGKFFVNSDLLVMFSHKRRVNYMIALHIQRHKCVITKYLPMDFTIIHYI